MSFLRSTTCHAFLEIAIMRESHYIIQTGELLIKNRLQEVEFEFGLATLANQNPKFEEDVVECLCRQPVLKSLAEILSCQLYLLL